MKDRPDLGGQSHARTRQLLHLLEERISRLPLSAAARLQIGDAMAVMLNAHYRQPSRIDGQVYVNHPLEVTLTVLAELHVTRPEVIMAALLHDTVEDQAAMLLQLLGQPPAAADALETAALAAISAAFGARVAALVGLLTNPDFVALEAEAAANGRFLSKYELYAEHVIALYAQDVDAFLIKLADLSQNALQLHRLPESARKQHFRRKYGPVMQFVIRELGRLTDPAHPLFPVRDALVRRFSEVYQRDYAAAADGSG